MLKKMLAVILMSFFTVSVANATTVNVVNVSLSEGGFLSFDYSWTVSAIVINKGRSGDATLNTSLTCGKHNWKQQKEISIDKGETMTVKFTFTEPTIDDSSECVAEVKVSDSWF